MLYFAKELQLLINKYSRENESNTPDYILATYLEGCLSAYTAAVKQREEFYGRDAVPTTASVDLSEMDILHDEMVVARREARRILLMLDISKEARAELMNAHYRAITLAEHEAARKARLE